MTNLNQDSKAFFDFLKDEDYPVFFQGFKPNNNGERQKGALNGIGSYHDNFESLLAELKKYGGKGILCLGLQLRQENTTTVEGVDFLQIIAIDIDVKKERKIGFVSTKEDHKHALSKAHETKKILKEKFNINTDLIVDSGNGAQVLAKIRVPVKSIQSPDDWHSSEHYKKLVEIERVVGSEIDDEVVKVDAITKDINRRLKIPGTINNKDLHQIEDRVSKILFQSESDNTKSNTKSFLEIKCDFKEEIIQEFKLPDRSRSTEEFVTLLALIKDGNSKQRIWEVMGTTCEKWKASPESYRKHQYKAALKRIKKDNVRLPANNYPFSKFAKEVSKSTQGHEKIYYRPQINSFVEVTQLTEKLSNQKIVRFENIKPARLLNLLEEEIDFMCIDQHGNKKKKSPSEQHMKILFDNNNFRNSLNPVDRILTCGMPFIIQGKLILPKIGYDPELNSYLMPNSPKIELITLTEAKEIIEEIFKEFCFKKDKDKTIAIAAFITPACRGLFSRITIRTPLFFYVANRERCGKDYCAGITGIVYEGISLDDPPISTIDKYSNSNEELRKKLTSGIKEGRRRFHFANNKGHLNNSVLEQFITSEHWKDRLLGKNKEIQLNNEVDVSLSANIGTSWSADIDKRSRFIELFFGGENINARKFNKPDLHGWVMDNRSKILSAIYTLIYTWDKAGRPEGKTLFASFPDWAKIVGGIMEYHGFGDPCLEIQNEFIGGDIETQEFRMLWKFMYEKFKNQEFTVREIMDKIENWQLTETEIFSGYEFLGKPGRTKFGIKFKKYIGREFEGIVLNIKSKNEKVSHRQTYVFNKIK